jgi:hypothetical protein
MADVSISVREGLSPEVLSGGFTVLIALTGWAWGLFGGWRDRRRFGKLVREAAHPLLQAIEPVGRLDRNATKADVIALAAGIDENPVVPTLDQLVDNVPLERWPSADLYIATRYLRDRVKVFTYQAKADGGLPGWTREALPGLVADVRAAVDRFRRA